MPIATSETTVAEFFATSYRPSRNLRSPTVAQYEVQIRHLDRQLGRRARISDLSDELICATMSALMTRGDDAQTANKVRLHINSIWRLAEERELLQKRPRNKKYRVDLRAPIAWLPEEKQLMIDTAMRLEHYVGDVPAAHWWLTILLFQLCTGLRIGASFCVPTANLDLNGGLVQVPATHQKHRCDQTLDLWPGLVHWLRELRLAERGVETIFGDWPSGIRCWNDHFADLYVQAGWFKSREAVPREYKSHILRKTLASEIFAQAGIEAARERLGHSTITVTLRYIDPRYTRQVRIGELVPDPSPAQLPTTTLKLFRAAVG